MFHVNLETGESGRCRAKIPARCPFDSSAPHFEHERDAQKFFEVTMEKGQPQAEKLFAVVADARSLRRAEEKLGFVDDDSEQAAELHRIVSEKKAALRSEGLTPEQVIDYRSGRLRNISDIQKLVLSGKPLWEQAVDRKGEKWQARAEKFEADNADVDPKVRARAAMTLKLSILREIPIKRAIEDPRISANFASLTPGQANRVYAAMPGIGEAAQARRNEGLTSDEDHEKYNESVIDRASKIMSSIK